MCFDRAEVLLFCVEVVLMMCGVFDVRIRLKFSVYDGREMYSKRLKPIDLIYEV